MCLAAFDPSGMKSMSQVIHTFDFSAVRLWIMWLRTQLSEVL